MADTVIPLFGWAVLDLPALWLGDIYRLLRCLRLPPVIQFTQEVDHHISDSDGDYQPQQ